MRTSSQKVVPLGLQGDFYPPGGFFGPQKRIINGQAKVENYRFEYFLLPLVYVTT